MNTIMAGGAVPSAGSLEALCALKASSAGLADHLSAFRLSRDSQHLGLVLALCAALGTVIFSLQWYALLASRVLSHSSAAYVLPGMSRGPLESVIITGDA